MYTQFMEELSRGLVFLSAPDRDGLREALEAPVEMVGYRFESSAMVGDMLDALAGRGYRFVKVSTLIKGNQLLKEARSKRSELVASAGPTGAGVAHR